MKNENPAPLEGIRVVEMGRVLAAPFCAMMLGDMGADVIKVEMPPGGDDTRNWGPYNYRGMSYYIVSANRNKRSISLDLKQEEGAEALRRLLATADVFLHNTLPGAIERLGFGYSEVSASNPKLVYCMITGWGLRGPQRDRPAVDMMAQAGSGLMLLAGPPGGEPSRAGVPVADLSAAMYAAYAILAALRQRDLTGRGQLVDTSLIEAAVSTLHHLATQYFITGESPPRVGNAHPSIVPYDTFRTTDGWVALAVINEAAWSRFCQGLGLDSLVADPRFDSRSARADNRGELTEIVGRRLKEMPTQEVLAVLDASSVPCEEVKDVRGVFESENVKALGLRVTFNHPEAGPISVVGTPYHLSQWPDTIRQPAPKLGEHSEEILKELGYDSAAIRRMRRSQAVR